MKQLIYSALFLLAASAANAQWYNPDKVNAKAQFVYSGAIDALRDGDWQAGKNLLRLFFLRQGAKARQRAYKLRQRLLASTAASDVLRHQFGVAAR